MSTVNESPEGTLSAVSAVQPMLYLEGSHSALIHVEWLLRPRELTVGVIALCCIIFPWHQCVDLWGDLHRHVGRHGDPLSLDLSEVVPDPSER